MLIKAEKQTQSDTEVLMVEVKNTGDAPLPKTAFRARVLKAQETPGQSDDPASVQLLDEITVPTIDAGATRQIPFVLPKDKHLESDPLLDFRGRSIPETTIIHAWGFSPRTIEIGLPSWAWMALGSLTALLLLLSAAYLRIFRHPLVVQLSSAPRAILTLPPNQLTRAKRALGLARRLDTVLADVELSTAQLGRAVDAFKGSDSSAPARLLAERLMGSIKPISIEPLPVFELTLGPDFPLNLLRCMVVLPPRTISSLDAVEHLLRVPELREQNTVVLCSVPEQHKVLADKAKLSPFTVIVPKSGAFTELLIDPDPNAVFARIISHGAKLTTVSPYQTKGGVEKASVFFGRDKILTHILSRDLANYFLVGGRQLGKSSLLKAIEWRLRADTKVACRYVSLSGEEAFEALAHALGIPWNGNEAAVLSQMGDVPPGTTRLLLLDEVDRFVEADAATGFKTLHRFRNPSETGKCRFILAGFWSLFEEVSLNYQSPIKNFGEVISLGALEPEACRRLATEPMAAMNLSFASADLVDRLVAVTGGRANLIAIACNEILKSLSQEERRIDSSDLDLALDSDAILEALQGWGSLLGPKRADETRLDRMIVYATAEKGEFTQKEMLDILEGLGRTRLGRGARPRPQAAGARLCARPHQEHVYLSGAPVSRHGAGGRLRRHAPRRMPAGQYEEIASFPVRSVYKFSPRCSLNKGCLRARCFLFPSKPERKRRL